jgi:hypothetical protein
MDFAAILFSDSLVDPKTNKNYVWGVVLAKYKVQMTHLPQKWLCLPIISWSNSDSVKLFLHSSGASLSTTAAQRHTVQREYWAVQGGGELVSPSLNILPGWWFQPNPNIHKHTGQHTG